MYKDLDKKGSNRKCTKVLHSFKKLSGRVDLCPDPLDHLETALQLVWPHMQ